MLLKLYRVDWDLLSYYYSHEEALSESANYIEPTLPHHTMEGEDHTIPRICLSDSVLNCINSIGVGTLLNEIEYCEKFHYSPCCPINIYTFIVDTTKTKIISPKGLVDNGLVPDALKFHEYWALNNLKTTSANIYYLGYKSFSYKMPLNYCVKHRIPPIATSVKLLDRRNSTVQRFKWDIIHI